ncbi:unnamed protein product [Mycetohabitans rhizoxinica HKI 454]|uniref:Uncharacterized protein n=1 Tax=Mycetohabitans rhizoxinica (strain DSM 19002 / CIP 109453 / HKI 454) TaxID=882378 RepID=E5AP69_MYCRK|nr:unnamed protein product [Mycetohabitans rhizoxinica HKI 454]
MEPAALSAACRANKKSPARQYGRGCANAAMPRGAVHDASSATAPGSVTSNRCRRYRGGSPPFVVRHASPSHRDGGVHGAFWCSRRWRPPARTLSRQARTPPRASMPRLARMPRKRRTDQRSMRSAAYSCRTPFPNARNSRAWLQKRDGQQHR